MEFFNLIFLEYIYRKMGYFADQSGILRRYLREREGWDLHLQKTKEFALKAMQKKKCKSAAVLGSGWLLDVPVEEMSEYFEKVYLYDIRHPTKVKKRVKQLENVELRAIDISCFALPVYQYVKQKRNSKNRPPISDIQSQTTLELDEFDFVFSCNILNQLDILLIEYLSQFFDLRSDEIVAFRKNVQKCHINSLPRKRSCMVVDYEEITYTPEGREIARKSSVYNPIISRADVQRWLWEFDTKMTYYKDKKTFFEVLAVEI